MALWDKVRQELDRAGRVAQDALDEGRTRLEAHRVRQLADKAAQALGYAVYRARVGGGELDAEAYARLSATLAGHEAEATRLEEQLESIRRGEGAPAGAASTAGAADAPPTGPTPGAPETAAGGPSGYGGASGYGGTSSTSGGAYGSPGTSTTGGTPGSSAPGGTPGGGAPPPSAGTGPTEPWSPTI